MISHRIDGNEKKIIVTRRKWEAHILDFAQLQGEGVKGYIKKIVSTYGIKPIGGKIQHSMLLIEIWVPKVVLSCYGQWNFHWIGPSIAAFRFQVQSNLGWRFSITGINLNVIPSFDVGMRNKIVFLIHFGLKCQIGVISPR